MFIDHDLLFQNYFWLCMAFYRQKAQTLLICHILLHFIIANTPFVRRLVPPSGLGEQGKCEWSKDNIGDRRT